MGITGSLQNSDQLIRAQQARDKLIQQFLNHPEVNLIDIGYDLDSTQQQETPEHVVLRVHVRFPSTRKALNFPLEIDDVPVRVVVSDYNIE